MNRPAYPFSITGWDTPGKRNFNPGDLVRIVGTSPPAFGVVIGPDPERIFDYAVVRDGHGTHNRHFYNEPHLERIPWEKRRTYAA